MMGGILYINSKKWGRRRKKRKREGVDFDKYANITTTYIDYNYM